MLQQGGKLFRSRFPSFAWFSLASSMEVALEKSIFRNYWMKFFWIHRNHGRGICSADNIYQDLGYWKWTGYCSYYKTQKPYLLFYRKHLTRILSTTKPCHLVVASYNVAGREKSQRKIYFSSRFYEAMNLYTDGLHTSNGHGNLCPHRSTRRGSCWNSPSPPPLVLSLCGYVLKIWYRK